MHSRVLSRAYLKLLFPTVNGNVIVRFIVVLSRECARYGIQIWDGGIAGIRKNMRQAKRLHWFRERIEMWERRDKIVS